MYSLVVFIYPVLNPQFNAQHQKNKQMNKNYWQTKSSNTQKGSYATTKEIYCVINNASIYENQLIYHMY